MLNKNDNIGILDPEGINLNPLNGKPYSDKYKKLAEKWKTFPVYQKAREIIDDINNNQVLLLVSFTGSGKSVIQPKLVLHTLNYTGKIAMTLPKQIITKSAAEFAAETLDVELGQEVGYQYKGSDPKMRSNKTKILYTTDGTIVAKAFNDSTLKEYDAILIDELHEQSVNISLLLYLMRETLKLRPEFKLILMSATINTEIFATYFKDFKFKVIDGGGARLFPITPIFLPKTLDYKSIIDEGFKTLIKILEEDDPATQHAHDIIFFVTSSNEAYNLCKMLNNHLEKEKKTKCKITCKGDVYCIEVFAGMDPKKQTLAQDKSLYKENTKYNRKVVIATNVAESSLTIDGVKYVIDVGYEFKSIFDSDNRARKLDRELIAQAQAKQRMGRAGRTEPGICYHLYTEDDFNNNMKKFPDPEIKTSDITSVCLNLLNNEQINSVEKLTNTLTNFIEPPREAYIRIAINNLIQLGAVENDTITKLGKLINRIPDNNMFMATAIIFGKIYNCSHEIMKISAIIEACKGNLSDLYNLPTALLQNKQNQVGEVEYNKMLNALNKKFNESRSKFANINGDHLSLLNIYEKFEDQYKKHAGDVDKLNDWAHDKFLKVNKLLAAHKNYKLNTYQMYSIYKEKINHEELGIKCSNDILDMDINDRVLCCLLLGFRLNTAAKQAGTDIYKTQFSKTGNIKINKISFLSLKSNEPSNVFYHELFISMGKYELVIVSDISKKLIKLLS